MYLFFDTETNGIPKNYKAKITDLDNWPRVIQLAYILYDNQGSQLLSSCNLIKPDNWEIPKQKFWIDNGYSTEVNAQQGKPMKEELIAFASAINQCQVMIAHNINFDVPVLSCEMIRYNVKAQHKPAKFCTMLNSTDICQIPGQYGYKWPKLEELYSILFGETLQGAHDALVDVEATAKCFFELKNKGLFNV
jgi:DNA polymerase III epsilon subunit-like protein